MKANPLIGGSEKKEQPKVRMDDSRVVKLCSNSPAGDISGLEDFLAVFNGPEAHAVIEQFRHVIQRRAKRSVGGKFARGLSTEVMENVEIKPNEDLFGLRRWFGTIRQDPASIMLLNLNKIKEDAVAGPLVFSEMLKTGRPILVTGADPGMASQLLANIDLTCQKIPPEIDEDHQLKISILARIQRRKGFVQTIRNLMEFDYLPQPVRDKIAEINTGGDPASLSEAEIINLCLLADLSSRYRAVLEQFKTAVEKASVQVPQMVSMFELLTADVPLAHVIQTFDEFMDKETTAVDKIANKAQVFGHAYRFMQQDDGSSRTGRMDRMSKFHKTLSNLLIRSRVRVDPFLWKHCHFLGKQDPLEKQMTDHLKTLFQALVKGLRSPEQEVPETLRKQLALQVFELVENANKSPAEFKSESQFTKHRVANRLLRLFHQKNSTALDLSVYSQKPEALKQANAFLEIFHKMPLSKDDIRGLLGRLRPVLFPNDVVAAEIQKSTLDVVNSAAKDRERVLRDIYILNALSELTTYSIFIGDKGLTQLDRVSAIAISQNRLGLDVTSAPTEDFAVGLFTKPEDAGLGKLQNDPSLLQLAYTELVSLQVERLVKRAVDRKINYLQKTYGTLFFEVIYNSVVSGNNLPVSRDQFATIIKERNVLGNLDAKGWKPANGNEMADPFMVFVGDRKSLHKNKVNTKALENFDKKFAHSSSEFRKLLQEVKAGAVENPVEDNPKAVLWALFKQGVYNLSRPEAKSLLRKSAFFKYLQDMIAEISSENYSTFTSGIVEGGIRIFLPWKYAALQLIGNRFGFLVGENVVKYQLLTSPTENPTELDEISRLLLEQLEAKLSNPEAPANLVALREMVELMERANNIWREYSRMLSIGVLDKVLSDTVIKQLVPGKIDAKNLLYLPDHTKLCLGRAVISSEAVQFGKVLQAPENMGNVVKNPKSSSTTIDDFSIQVHQIGRLAEELLHYRGLAEDVIDVIQSLSHERSDGGAMGKIEGIMQHFVRLLSKPLRHIKEKDVQDLHTLAQQYKEVLSSFYNSHSPIKQKVPVRIQSELQSRRSDGHSIKLAFADDFIIDKTEIKITRNVERDGEMVKRQKKIEVELEASHQTLPIRVRNVINLQNILSRKRHVVFSPEGHKQKQIDYAMDIIHILLELRGNGLTFYVDTSGISPEQVEMMAKSIKPHNFFNMDQITPEPPKGIKVTTTIDPLSGRPVEIIKKDPAALAEPPPPQAD